MPRWRLTILCLGVLITGACARASDNPLQTGSFSPPVPTAAHVQGSADGTLDAALTTALLTLDPAALSAALSPVPSPRLATASDQVAVLDLGNFFDSDSLRIAGVSRGEGTIDLRIEISHPFRGPIVSQPGSASNRADLGFAGRFVILADVPLAQRPQAHFFGDSIRTSLGLVTNAHGYIEPRGLIPTETFANTFPYVLVVDELADNRLGITNNGLPTGNYYASVGGWQRNSLGSNGNGWTGYGVLHQGQSAEFLVRLDADLLGNGPIEIPVALLAKYVRPTGGDAPWEHRIPASIANVDHFAYRMPYGAIDASDVFLNRELRLTQDNPNSSATIELAVRDWDARALATVLEDLAQDTDVARIPPGTVGVPRVTVDAPYIDATGAFGLDEYQPDTRSGLPGHEILYRGTLHHVAARPAGQYWGLARVFDPEASDPDRFGKPYETDLTRDLEPITDPALRMEPVTYQALPILVTPPSQEPVCEDCHLSTGNLQKAVPFKLNLSSFIDDSALVQLRLRYDGPESALSGIWEAPPAALTIETALDPWTDTRFGTPLPIPTTPGTYGFYIQANDFDHQVEFGPLSFYVLQEGACPEVPFNGTAVTDPAVWQDVISMDELVDGWSDLPFLPASLATVGFRNQPGWFLTQGPDNTFWRFNPTENAAQRVSNPGYPGSGWSNRALLIELDSQGRACWVASHIDQSQENDPSLDTIYEYADSVVHVMRTDGAPVSADLTSFDVGFGVVAMCIDETDAIWVVDASNAIRRFVRLPDGTYEEEAGAEISLGASSAGGILGAAVYDIDIDFYNHAFFLPVRSFGDYLTLWRVECDGTLVQPNGNANPLTDIGGEPVRDAVLVIDNFGPSRQVLNGQQDAQLLIGVENGAGWIGMVTSEMDLTSHARGTRGSSRLAIDYFGNTAYSLADQSAPAGTGTYDRWQLPTPWS